MTARRLAAAAALFAIVLLGWMALTRSGPFTKPVADVPTKKEKPGIDAPPRKPVEPPPAPPAAIVENRKDAAGHPPPEPPAAPSVVREDSPKASPPADAGSELDKLLAAIGKYPASQPLDVADTDVRTLRERAAAYQKQSSNPPVPAIAAFVTRSELTDANELRYLAFFAEAAEPAAEDPAKLAACVARIMALRSAKRALVNEGKPLRLFLDKALAAPSPALDEVLRKEVADATALLPRNPNQVAAQSRRILLCQLPPAVSALRDDLQRYARARGDQLDPALRDFLLHARRPGDTLGMIIPVYWGNLDQLQDLDAKTMLAQWTSIKAVAAQRVAVKVVNRLPSAAANQNVYYRQLLVEAKSLHIQIYAYVYAGRGNQGLEKAKAEASRWHELYKGMFSGIFIDNVPANEAGSVKDFTALYDHVVHQDKIWQLIVSANQPCDEAYRPPATSSERPGIVCVDANLPVPKANGWEAKYDPNGFAAVIHRAGSDQSWDEILFEAAGDHYGWIYVVDTAVGLNPYRSFPAYFHDEANAMVQINSAITGKGNGPARKNPTRKGPVKKRNGPR